MATKQEIIDHALELLAIASYEFELSANERQSCLNFLDRMMAEWDSRGIRVGYALSGNGQSSSTADQSGLSDWAITPVAANLAMRVAPMFGKAISNDVANIAKTGLESIELTTYSPPPMIYPPTAPRGQGWPYQFGWWNRYYHNYDNGIDAQHGGELIPSVQGNPNYGTNDS